MPALFLIKGVFMSIDIYPCGPLDTNCYLVINEESKEALLIDSPPDSYETIMEIVEQKELKILALLLTHGHFDHISDDHYFVNDGIPVYGAEDTRDMIKDPHKYMPFDYPGLDLVSIELNSVVRDGENVEIGSFKFKTLEAPGHCPGSVLYLFEDDKSCIVGDVLFQRSIGRSDFPGGNHQTLINSIKTKIFTLPDDMRIYPGHGPSTSVGSEKRENPFFQD